MLHILLQWTDTGQHVTMVTESVKEAGMYLGGPEEADGLQMFHAVSVLRVDALKQVDLLLQDL